MEKESQQYLEYRNKLNEIKAIESELDSLVSEYRTKVKFLVSYLDTTPDFIFLINWRLRIKSVNPSFVKFMGYPKEYLIDKSYYDILPSEIADKFMRDDRTVLETGDNFECEDRLIGVHGEIIVHTLRTPIFENQHIKGIIVSMRDVTRLRSIERDLNEKNKILENISVLDPNYVMVFNLENGVIYYQNRSLLKNMGFTREKNIEDFKDFVHPDDLDSDIIAFFTNPEPQEQYQSFRIMDSEGNWQNMRFRTRLFDNLNLSDENKIVLFIENISQIQ